MRKNFYVYYHILIFLHITLSSFYLFIYVHNIQHRGKNITIQNITIRTTRRNHKRGMVGTAYFCDFFLQLCDRINRHYIWVYQYYKCESLFICLLFNNVKTNKGIRMKFRAKVDYGLVYNIGYYYPTGTRAMPLEKATNNIQEYVFFIFIFLICIFLYV